MKQAIHLILFFILVSGFGCRKNKNSYPALSTNAKADSFIIETYSFEIGSKKYIADFGTITVPENRSISTSRLINIPFFRIHSNSRNPADPIFGLTGGPGQSNMSWDLKFVQTFLSEHDFVLVGYRGVDGSCVLDCPEVTKSFMGDNDPLSEKSMKKIGRAWSNAADRLKAQGVDLDGYTMLECIEDNESVRRALGYERINLSSGSYGTRVAYLYGLKHPEHIFRSVMIGVNPPGRFVWEPREIDEQLKYYASLWSKDSILSQRSPDLYETMRKVLGNIPRKWFFISINPGKVKVVAFCLLFQHNTAALVFNAFVAAEHGDASGLAMMSVAYNYIVPSLMTWGDLASKAVSADFDSTRNYCSDMDPSSNLPLGSPLSKLLWGPLTYGHWPVKQLPEEFRTPQESDVETLLLSGSVDFSTPAEFATKELLPYLKKGKQIIFSECGHVGDVEYFNAGNTKQILKCFFNNGVADISLNTYIPMDFSVKWGFPKIAKIVVCLITIIAIAVIIVIVWIIRRYWKQTVSVTADKTIFIK
jgi:pimeloyl-ACP methyl ester carboxylesterase